MTSPIDVHELVCAICEIRVGTSFFVLILRSAGVIKYGDRPKGMIICSKNDRKNFIIKTPWQQMLTAQCNYKGTWIEPMVVINSQPWGIGHWFVFKRVCVHCIGMKATYFSDSFLITYICQLIPKLTNHINKKVNILMTPLITKIKQNLHQKIQEKLVCSAAYLSVNTFVFKQQSFHSEVMERSCFISGDNKIITPGKKSLFMHCYKF